MNEDPLDDLASSLRERHFRGVSMHAMTRNVPPHTVFDVDVEHALEPLHPAHGGRRRMGFAEGWTSTVGDDVVAVFEVRCETAVVSGEMGAGAWHEGDALNAPTGKVVWAERGRKDSLLIIHLLYPAADRFHGRLVVHHRLCADRVRKGSAENRTEARVARLAQRAPQRTQNRGCARGFVRGLQHHPQAH